MPHSKEPGKPLGVRLAELQAHLDIQRGTDKVGHYFLWGALRELAALLAAVIRRLPPEG